MLIVVSDMKLNTDIQALEQIASKQAEVDRLRTESANLRAEKEQWQSNEYRLQTDFRAVQSERAKLQQLIDNLNSVSAESEKSRSEERKRLEKRVEEVQRET
jgi:nucleoprotein TPR